uniref:uncharacterized protein LOC122583676 n=1 Tax=Erigeron canadensis TaxID=72917 RepID=UPI001CB93721|nr:uncharacterized protein LOC122583676 [Erigeron canadensis]
MIRVAIGGKSKNLLNHLSDLPPEKASSEKFETWEQEDLIVFSWLIQNIEPNIAGNLTEFSTAKELWDALVTTYSSGKDKLQAYNLHVKANEIKQTNKPIEDFWISLQGIWGEIDRIDPNPMKCPKDIKAYNKIRSDQKLFQFLSGLDQKFESVKKEILRLDPLPAAEAAYATIRKEAAHQQILGATTTTAAVEGAQGIATGLMVKEENGFEFATKRFNRSSDKQKSVIQDDKSHLTCDECGLKRHTKDQCFRLVGYPEWWVENKKGRRYNPSDRDKSSTTRTNPTKESNSSDGRRSETGFGGVAAAEGEQGGGFSVVDGKKKETSLSNDFIEKHRSTQHHHLPNPPLYINLFYNRPVFNGSGNGLPALNRPAKIIGPKSIAKGFVARSDHSKSNGSWIFDCGATDTMTSDISDFSIFSKPKRTHIQAANYGKMDVMNGGSVMISPNIRLTNCLYVPSLSYKLLSISHVTKELNC